MKRNESSEFCPSGKVAYSSKAKALSAALLCGKGNRKFRVYYCTMCGKWHLTTTYSDGEVHEIRKTSGKYNRLDNNKSWTKFRETIPGTTNMKCKANESVRVRCSSFAIF